MAPALGADDWIVPDAAPAAPAPQRDAHPDDWVVPKASAKPEDRSSLGSVAQQVPTGFNEELATIAGAPVDVTTWLLNRIPGVDIKTPFGGSESIKSGMAAVGVPFPEAKTTAEKIARGAGQGVAMALVPEAALAGAARAGAVAPRVADTLGHVFGRGDSVPAVAGNAIVGGAAGGGAVAAGEAAPEPYKPMAELAGGLAGGLAGVGGIAAGRGAAALAPSARDYVAPLISSERERLAGEALASRATSPRAALDTLQNEPQSLVAGSQPTTFQASGDMGLGSLEREVAAGSPAEFQQRRADQNLSRVQAIQRLQDNGSPADVANFVRQEFRALDEASAADVTSATGRAQAAGEAVGGARAPEAYGADIGAALAPGIERATGAARSAVDALGGVGQPEAYGQSMRGSLADARASARARERALWTAVDPSGALTLDGSPLKQAAAGIEAGMTDSARPIGGEERAVFDVIAGYRPVIPFRDLTDMRSRISTAMREELRSAGETPSYGRLARLRSAVEQTIEAAVEGRAAEDERAVAGGQLLPEDTIGARLVPQGGNSVYTPAGRRIDVRYRLVDAANLVPSHGADMQPNPEFPAELQPRDRSRAISATQISRIASDLQPERLGASTSAVEGAPIVGPDGVVESGNARVAAIRRAYQAGLPSAARYRAYLAAQGFDPSAMREPVLVRERVTPLSLEERASFAQEANASPTLTMSASEQALADSTRLSDDVLRLYQGGSLTDASNRGFVRAFLARVPIGGEAGSFVTADGSLSADGARRIQNALLQAAYDDPSLVRSIAEADDENIRSFGRIMNSVAGEMGLLRRDAISGRIDAGADLSGHLRDAGAVVQDARSKGVKIADAVAQHDAFDPISAEAELILRAAYGPDLAGRLAGGRFTEWLRRSVHEASQQTTEARLFGSPLTARDIFESQGSLAHAPDIFPAGDVSGGSVDFGPLARAGGHSYGQPGLGSARAGSADASEAVLGPEAVAFDPAAAERLRAATAATRERKQIFDQGPVGTALRSGGMQGQYRTINAAVPDTIFKPGPGGFEAVQAYRAAVGDDPAALGTLHDYAMASLRRTAERTDGTLDPARYAAWRRKYQDALRGIPGLQDRLDQAVRLSEAVDQARPLGPDVSAAHVPETFFHAGTGGFEDVQRLRGLIGDARADFILSDYAASRLRAAAMRADGTLDPGRFAAWRRSHADALRAFPALDARFADAARASEAVAEAAAQRKAALDAYQAGAFGRMIGVTDPQDVTRVIGGIFGARDSVAQMRRLSEATARDPAARAGLRRAIVDHIANRFISNAEAGTSGEGAIKADSLQTFLRQNGEALAQIFAPDEMANLRNIAGDLRRANRSITAVKLPGGSNTAQDTAGQRMSMLRTILRHSAEAAVGGGAGFMLGGGALGSLVGAVGATVVSNFREAGLRQVDDLIRAAMLDPRAGALLLQRAAARPDRGPAMRLAQYLRRMAALALWQQPAAMLGRSDTGERNNPVRVETAADLAHVAERTAPPTPAQAKAGNYAKRHIKWKGLDLTIETEKGGERVGIGADGKPWSATMEHAYGYIKGTLARDGDQVDVYVGPHPQAAHVFVFDQIDPANGRFDEHKLVIGARDLAEAREIYDSGFSDSSGSERRGAVRELSVPELKAWLHGGNLKQPIAYRESMRSEASRSRFPTLRDLFNDPRSAADIEAEMNGAAAP